MTNFRKNFLFVFSISLIVIVILPACQSRGSIRFEVSYPEELDNGPLDGRLLVMISTDGSQEPRFQIGDGPRSQQVFGIDVHRLTPSEVAVIDESVLGYPP